jgi:uncharacterized BrkB/YihY/UPF0761 family membrane protein
LTLGATLRAIADCVDLDRARRRPRLLFVAALLSLALWTGIGWGLGWLVEWLVQS